MESVTEKQNIYLNNVIEPEPPGYFVYSILTPGICFLGIAGNLVCFIVLLKMKTRCSFYVYLTAIAVVDFFSCVVIFLTALTRGVLCNMSYWVALDGLILLPVGEFLHCVSACATIFVTIDRVIYLRRPAQTCKPKFCKRTNAMKVLFFLSLFSAVYITPYGFVYTLNADGTLYRTDFYESIYFAIFNWTDITVFAIAPVLILCVGNTLLLLSIRNACNTLDQCQKKLAKGKQRVLVDQTKLTITLMAIVIFYLIGEVPTRFTKKTSSPNILFGGDEKKAEESMMLEYSRQIITVLNAFHLAVKFILYAFFCPPFYRSLQDYVLKSMERCYNLDYSKLKIVPQFLSMTETQKLPTLL